MEFGIIDWDPHNIAYATRCGITIEEIEYVVRSTKDWRVNKKSCSGDVITTGRTEQGRRITVIAVWNPQTHTIRPINAWEAK
ncbi:MAG: hypothetical protein M0026_07895 [Nocardiopsaceae bacterium]|nr:hypothetical protein [Nocardiopsaceae bacterium]